MGEIGFWNELPISELNAYNAKSAPVILTTFEDYMSNFKSDSILSKYTELTFPNSTSSGTFYNLRTLSIIGQAQHFTTATSFANYYLSPSNNERLNNRLNTLPIIGNNQDIKLYNISHRELMQYYLMFKRILSRLT